MDSRVEQLLSRAYSLDITFQQDHEACCIDEAIVLDRQALEHCTSDHNQRPLCFVQLSSHLYARYKQFGGIETLNEAIVCDREALALLSPDNPNLSSCSNNLAVHLHSRFHQLGRVDDLNEAILLDRNVLARRPPGHPNRVSSLNNLAVDLCTRYNQLGGVEDLDEAILLDRETLSLCPSGHQNRSSYLINLSVHLHTRYDRLGGVDDLNEAILLDREALSLRSHEHPGRWTPLTNLAVDLCTRYKQLDSVEDIDEAIRLDREALILCPPGDPGRSLSLNNLADHLSTRYGRLKEPKDLDEAILLDGEALALCAPGHPDRPQFLSDLAFHLSSRCKLREEFEDLDKAITLVLEALELCPQGHPNRSQSLETLTRCLFLRFTQFGDPQDQENLFNLYTQLARITEMVSSRDLSASRAWANAAEHFHHPTILLAYESTLRLLVQHLAALPSLPQNLTVLKSLTSSLAADAFSACLRNHSPANAVELLEQGRGVFWSQLTRLRLPLDDVIVSGPAGKTLADEFARLTSVIRNALDSPSADQHDRVCRLNLELQRVVSSIRELPSLSRFLLPARFADLRGAAHGGPIIIMNASKYGCDALVVFADRDPVHIPLSLTKESVGELSSKLRTLTACVKRSDVTRELGILLRDLWDHVVSPIADFLQTTYPIRSRVWWCPTAEFSFLPLHAAGPYRRNQRNFADFYISSYTLTLSALIRARQHHASRLATEQKCFVAIGEANADGERELPSVGAELENISQFVDGPVAFTRIEGQESCISRVTKELNKNGWVHLACHGLANTKRPLESAFALHDGHFTIQRIIQCDLENPEFAYLSACHTTVGDEESPDEAIHLASAMQFAGFRSVIGTMWAVDDAETNKITSVFYKHMVDASGRLDHTRAAHALCRTMRTVPDIPLDQRVVYIHLGA